MKQTIKKLVLVVMCFTLICCEEKESNDNSFNFQQKTKTENPFNYLGERHNCYLDNFAEYLDGSTNFSTRNIYDFDVQENKINYNSMSYLDYKCSLDSIDDITFDYFFGTSPDVTTITSDSVVAEYLDYFRTLSLNAITSTIAMSPSDFSTSIERMEVDFMSKYSNLRDVEDSLRYVTVLGMLAIAKYSYQYWYDASFNKSSLWYPIIQNRLNVKSDKPSFWERCKDVANVVAGAVVGFTVDVVTYVKESVNLGGTVINSPNEKPIASGVNTSFDIGGGACDKAETASSNAYNNIVY